MTAITQQKADLKDILRDIVMSAYDEEDEPTRRNMAVMLLGRYMGKLTLRELRDWHEGITLTRYVRDRMSEEND